MATVALIAASLAALVLAVVGIRAYFLVKRLHLLLDHVDQLVASDVTTTVRALGDTARGARTAVAKLEGGLSALARTLERVERLSANLEPDSVARTVAQPVVTRLLGWVSGLRKGLGAARTKGPPAGEVAEGAETEAG
ncbi:MAG: hypothetical protein MUQ26_05120 [Armatimonadetes bacterium]|nr:hypothetical protein [Armatimonadota bacterium]